MDNLTISILWKDVALLELKVYIYKWCSNILQLYCAPWNNSWIPSFIPCALCVLFVMLYKVPEDGHMQWPKHVAVFSMDWNTVQVLCDHIIYCVCVATAAQWGCAYKKPTCCCCVHNVLQILWKLVNSDDHDGMHMKLMFREIWCQLIALYLRSTSEIHFPLYHIIYLRSIYYIISVFTSPYLKWYVEFLTKVLTLWRLTV